jgi:hypothetical protein
MMHLHETPLERLLRNAWQEPGLRPEFYKRLLDSEVLVPVLPQPGQGRQGLIAAGSQLQVICLVTADGAQVLPFYTSPERVFEASPAGEKCVVMITRELFESRRDMRFHINPFSRFGREFTPWEVRSLLDTGGIAVTERVWVPYKQDANLRPTEHPPEKVLSALRVLFARNFDIRAAYIAERCQPESNGETLLIVVDLIDGGDQVRALRETGTVITESVELGMSRFGVAVLPRDDSAVARYFLTQATPFYTIGLAGAIASPFKLPH